MGKGSDNWFGTCQSRAREISAELVRMSVEVDDLIEDCDKNDFNTALAPKKMVRAASALKELIRNKR